MQKIKAEFFTDKKESRACWFRLQRRAPGIEFETDRQSVDWAGGGAQLLRAL